MSTLNLTADFPRMMRSKLPALLDRMDESGTLRAAMSAVDMSCHKGPLTRLRVALISMVPSGKRAT